MKKYFILFILIVFLVLSFIWKSSPIVSAVSPSDYGLKEGDLISAIFSDDPDVYIVNEHGYKRLFLNPEIFKFYAHLGGFTNVKLVTSEVRDSFPTVGLFRNCEDKDQRVFGIDIEGEDHGQLHWVNTTGDQAVKDDPDFFKKVFCINKKEFNWYPKGNELKSVKEVPQYHRVAPVTPAIPAVPAIPATPASPSQPLTSPPITTPVPASGSFTPTPTTTSTPIPQTATPAIPATPAQPASSTPTPTADTIAPSTPTGLLATAISPSQINLSWNASTDNMGVDGYKIYRNGVYWYQVTKLNFVSSITAYSDTGLSSNTVYSYYIKAFDAAGNLSPASVIVSATTQSGTAICSGLNLIFQGGKTSYIIGETVTYTYTCTPSGSASYVEIQVVKPDGTVTTYNSASGSISTNTLGFGTSNLTAGNYTLRACFTVGCSSVTASLPFVITTSTVTPPIPSNLTASMASYSTATAPVVALEWNGGTNNITKFHIFNHTQGTAWPSNYDQRGLELLISNTNNTVEVHIGLVSGASGVYEFKVQACNSAGCSADSNTVSIRITNSTSTPIPISPSVRIISPNGGEQITRGQSYTFSWEEPSRTIRYFFLYLLNSSGAVLASNFIDFQNSFSGTLRNSSNLTLDWWIPLVIPEGSNYKARAIACLDGSACNSKISDDSDTYFNVIAAPTPTPTPTVSSPTNIQAVTTATTTDQPPKMWYHVSFDYTLQSSTQSFNVYRKRPSDSAFVKYNYNAQTSVNASILPLPASGDSNLYHRYTNTWEWWTVLPAPIPDSAIGDYQFYVTAVDTNGVESAPSATKSFKLYAAPIITSPADGSTVSTTPQITILTDPSISSQYVGLALYKQTTNYVWGQTSYSTNLTYNGTSLSPNDNPHRLVAYSSYGTSDRSLFAVSIFNVSTPTPIASTSFNFNRDLYLGLKGPDVKQLQALLADEVGYSTNLITGYFGQITKDGVKRLQEKYNIKPASGYFGAITRRALNAR